MAMLSVLAQAEPSAVAEIQRRYGDHLYAKHDYDAAIAQYTATIGFLEPSYVIRCEGLVCFGILRFANSWFLDLCVYVYNNTVTMTACLTSSSWQV